MIQRRTIIVALVFAILCGGNIGSLLAQAAFRAASSAPAPSDDAPVDEAPTPAPEEEEAKDTLEKEAKDPCLAWECHDHHFCTRLTWCAGSPSPLPTLLLLQNLSRLRL
jgi:hypothetical protein